MPKRAKAAPTKKSVVAITGTSSFVGSTVLAAIQRQWRSARCIAIDKQPPAIKLSRQTSFYRVDLTDPDTDLRLREILQKEACQTLIHAAVLTQPPRNLDESHELQSIGTMYLLTAAAAAGVRKLILVSTTDVYGAFPDNPNFLTETHPLRGQKLSPFLKDKVDVEQQFLQFASKYPQKVVSLLRLATILGRTVNNFKTSFFQNPMIPTVMGFDPLIQFVHERDIAWAFLKVSREDHPGIFNITARGVLPLSRAIHLTGRWSLPIPSPVIYPLADLLWMTEIGPAPSGHINFLKYLCVADGGKAFKELEFEPAYTSQEALLDFVGAHHE